MIKSTAPTLMPFILAMVIGLSACSGENEVSTPEGRDLIAEGRIVAETKCATCHAVDTHSQSTLAAAPPFRTAILDYDTEALGLDFEAHLEDGTDVMPSFTLEADEMTALLAYIQTIEAGVQK